MGFSHQRARTRRPTRRTSSPTRCRTQLRMLRSRMPTQTASRSKAEQAYAWIREKIRTREYEPGYRLVLSTIADALQVSVVPVREAIRQLRPEERRVGK